MSDRVTADLDPHCSGDPARLYFHAGGASAPLARWRAVLQAAAPRGWDGVRVLADEVMRLVADPRVLFTAATELRAGGEKAPGPNGLPLMGLDRDELWAMCAALGAALAGDTYRPGAERVVWMRKASGRGRRPIVIGDVQDRVVARAAAQVLRPALDSRLDPLSFAFRAGRGREHAVAAAEVLTAAGGPVWLAHDVRHAFRRVPLPRLLDVVGKVLPCPRLREFLARALPPRSRSVGGIKQGSPLSPLMLELYLTSTLHEPWRRRGLPPLLRYADDLLVTAPDRAAAAAADAALRAILTPAGMLLRASFPEAVVDVREVPAEWLGFRCRLAGRHLRVALGAGATGKLARRFVLGHAKCRPAERAAAVLRHWVGQLGPCYRAEDRPTVCRAAREVAAAHDFEETPGEAELENLWAAADVRWRRTRHTVRHTPGYFVCGPVVPPTPASVIR